MRFVFLVLILALILSGCSSEAHVEDATGGLPQTDCWRGKSNDPYPGSCGRYIDLDSNGICDHSE